MSLTGAELRNELSATFNNGALCQSLATGGPAELVAALKSIPGVDKVTDVAATATLTDDTPARTTHQHDGPGGNPGT